MSLIRFFGHALAHGVAGELKKAKLRKIERQKTTICCADCETVLAYASKACHSCGSARLCSQFDLELAKIGANFKAKSNEQMNSPARMQEVMIAAHERQRDRDFKALKKALSAGMICPQCNVLYESTHKFCPTCATQTEKADVEVMEAFLRQDFPERFED